MACTFKSPSMAQQSSVLLFSANKWIFASSAAHDRSTTSVPGKKQRRTHRQKPDPKFSVCKQIMSSEIKINYQLT
jgi:hypothetical protein